MQSLNRSGVEFDMCPSCRGVWLDRGELEKIIEESRLSAAPPPQAAAPTYQPLPQQRPAQQPSYGYGERGENGERGEYGERGQGYKRRSSIFDIFD